MKRDGKLLQISIWSFWSVVTLEVARIEPKTFNPNVFGMIIIIRIPGVLIRDFRISFCSS